MRTQRIEYLDFLKCFAIFCVVLGHSVQYISGKGFWEHPLWAFIYSFHMPLFMLVSGYFFGSSLKTGFAEMVRKKFVQLVVPTLSAAVIVTVVWMVRSMPSLRECLMQFAICSKESLWFLKSVFLCFVAAYVFMKAFRKPWVAATVSILFFNLAPKTGLYNVNFLLPMFWAGYLCRVYQDFIHRHHRVLLAVSAIAFAVLLSRWSGFYTIYKVGVHIVDWEQLSVDRYNLMVTAFRFAIGLSGSMTFFLLSPLVWQRIKGTFVADRIVAIGKSTLGIYWFQSFALEVAVGQMGLALSAGLSSVIAPLLAVAELLLCYFLVSLTRRSRCLRLLILGESSDRVLK